MARPIKQNEPPEPILLAVPRSSAERQLNIQITEGNELLGLRMNDSHDLKSLSERYKEWSDFTEELLSRLFTGLKYHDEFWASTDGPYVVYEDDYAFVGEVEHARGNIKAKNTVLNSIVRRLAIIPEQPTAVQSSSARLPQIQTRPADPRSVFVVHGRNGAVRASMFAFLRAIGLNPMEWNEAVALTNTGAPFIGNVLDEAFAKVRAVIVLFTPDEEARLKEEYASEDDPPYVSDLYSQARPNVLFEAGLAFGRHPDQTILVEVGKMRPFTDVSGRLAIRLNNSPSSRQTFAQRLQSVGCQVNLNGTDWHNAGDFSIPKPDALVVGTKPTDTPTQG